MHAYVLHRYTLPRSIAYSEDIYPVATNPESAIDATPYPRLREVVWDTIWMRPLPKLRYRCD